MKVRTLLGALFLALALVPAALADQLLVFRVPLRDSVDVDVAVRIIDNPQVVPPALNLAVVHGLAQTGATFRPLANALFSEGMGNKVGRVMIIDLPGHGQSGLPTGMLFGDLALEDYTTAVLGAFGSLQSRGFSPDVLLAHSMGGVIIQMAQERLVSQGSSLRSTFGVRGAVLIAPVIPANLPWAFADSGAAASILGPLVQFVPPYGVVVDFPPPFWVGVFYTNRAGVLVEGAPSPEQAAAEFMSYESFVAGAQTVRLFAPPMVGPNLFGPGSGTELGVITLEQDVFFQFPDEHRAVYEYLTGDEKLKLFTPISGPVVVHNVHTVKPEVLALPIKKVLNAAWRPN